MRNLTSKALWIFFGDGGAKLFGFLATIYLARTLGASQYGLITIAISVLGITSWFSDLGLKTLATRSVAGNKPENRDPSRFLWLKIILSTGVMAIAGFIIWFVMSGQPLLRNLILLFILSLLPQALNIDWYYKGIQKFEWVTLASWIQGAIYLFALILLVSAEDLLVVPLIYSFSILAGAFTMILSYRGASPLSKRPNTSRWTADLKNSFYLGAGHFFAQSIILLPPLVIGYFFTEQQAGYYGVALKLILAVMIADHVINTLLLPNLTKLWREHRDQVQPQLILISRWVLYFGAAGTLFLSLSAAPLIDFLFGTEYQPAVSMLIVLSWLLPVTFLNSVYSFGLISFGKDRDFLSSTGLGAAGAVILLISASLSGQIDFLIGSVVLAEIWMTLCMYYRFKKVVQLPMSAYIAGMAALTILILLAGIFIPAPRLLTAVISPVILVGLLYIFGLLKPEDLMWLKRRVTQ